MAQISQMVFDFGGNSISVPSADELRALVGCCETLEMLSRRNSTHLKMYSFSIVAFKTLVHAVAEKTKFSVGDDLISIIRVSNYLGIREPHMLAMLPMCGLDQLTMNGKAMLYHTLYHENFHQLALTAATAMRMVPGLNSYVNLPWKEFKAKVRNLNRAHIWKFRYVYPMNCTCLKCQSYRHERLLQLYCDGEGGPLYATPYPGCLPISHSIS